jgi:hypothetical protein
MAERVAEGWETLWDGILRVAAVLSSLAEPAAGSSSYGTWTSSTPNPSLHALPADNATSLEPAFPKRSHFFDLQDLATGFRRQGRLTPNGKLPPQIGRRRRHRRRGVPDRRQPDRRERAGHRRHWRRGHPRNG